MRHRLSEHWPPVAAFVCLGLATCTALSAQNLGVPLGTTACWEVAREGRPDTAVVYSYVRVEFLGTDSLDEILVHEAVHRPQIDSIVRATGHCPSHVVPETTLALEIPAYCAFVRARARRTSKREALANAYDRLFTQFDGWIPRDTVTARFGRECKP